MDAYGSLNKNFDDRQKQRNVRYFLGWHYICN